jgi:hypothetical protein
LPSRQVLQARESAPLGAQGASLPAATGIDDLISKLAAERATAQR